MRRRACGPSWVCAKAIRCPISSNKAIRFFPKTYGLIGFFSIRPHMRPNKVIPFESFQILISTASVTSRHSKSIPSKTRQGGGGAARSEPDWMASANLQIGPEPIRGLTFSCFSRKKRFCHYLLEQFSIPQAQLWQLGAGARVRRYPVVNQGAL
jgi:hypothetical protein